MTMGLQHFDTIDWTTWKAQENATLMFIINGDNILLIRKKRGLGAGKVNGPGGRVEANESITDCAIRETQEELGISAIDPTLMGRHRFQFTDGYALQVFVYMTTEYRGCAIETDEAIPLWTPINQIPYNEMWEDDRLWLPLMLQGQHFDGCYLFDKERLIDYRLETVPADFITDAAQ